MRNDLKNCSKLITDHPVSFIQGLCGDLGYEIEDTILKGNQANEFWQQWHKAEDAFKEEILQTRPQFHLQKLGSDKNFSLSNFWLEGDFVDSTESLAMFTNDQPIYVADVRRRCEEARTVELSYVAYRVKESFYQCSIDKWDSPVAKLLDQADVIFSTCLTEIVDKFFKKYSLNGLNLRAQ